jgi:hypothetical protein
MYKLLLYHYQTMKAFEERVAAFFQCAIIPDTDESRQAGGYRRLALYAVIDIG